MTYIQNENLDEFVRGLSPDELEALELAMLVEVAQQCDDAAGFESFYRLVFGRLPPRHALEEWVRPFYEAGEAGEGLLIEAFRGSTKTTTATIGLVAFHIGHQPEKSNLLIQVGDDIAKDNAQQIADLIENNPGWKLVFPQVVPDRAAGWGADGYEVKRTDMDYTTWRKLCAAEKGKDPTFVGLGYKSRAIIGKHPTGMLVVDDIHDENNTRSGRELDTVIKILTGTIMPTLTPETRKIFIGTSWALNDVLAYVKATGEFRTVRTPVMRPAKEKPSSNGREQGADVRWEDWEAVWPEVFPLEEIEKQRQLAGEAEFARMFMLDLEAASGVHLKREWLHAYPYAQIDSSWPVVMGVDYASAADQLASSRRDYFAVAIGRVLPGGGGVVLVDGFRGRVSQGEAEQRLKALGVIYPTLQLVGVEAVGKGEEFYHLMLRTSELPLMPLQTGGRSKGERFERGMAPLFQFSRAWVADVETPFLRAFRDEWVRWPHGEHDDTLDAVYWMLYAARANLIGGAGVEREKRANPFAALGRG